MPRGVVFTTMNAVHRVVLKLSGGRTGWRAANMPVLDARETPVILLEPVS